jgi:predicted 3-demethylubiquinone-9 3-methyltransferase (glyoxalase superfamily)
MQKITPFLWFNDNAEEAVRFYASTFKGSTIGRTMRYDAAGANVSGRPEGSVMTIAFTIEGYEFTALNGGPLFTFTPAISFFVHCDTAEEVDGLWAKLSPGGKVRIELGEYPYSKRYGWIEDKFGVSWQLMLVPERSQKIVPDLLFVGENFGKAEEALKFYTSIFPDAAVTFIQKAGPGEPYNREGAVMYASFTLFGEPLAVMDGPGKHDFTFNEAISLLVNCDTQDEVDEYWRKLSAGGEEGPCGWLKDKYGVSWQIVPILLEKLLSDPDPAKSGRVMQAMLQMKKIESKALQEAYEGK